MADLSNEFKPAANAAPSYTRADLDAALEKEDTPLVRKILDSKR